MAFGRIGTWRDEGILGVLAMHIAVFFVFVLIVSYANLAFEERFVSWISDASGIQIITTLVLVLIAYVAVEAVLLRLLMQPYRSILDHPWAEREWVAYVILGGMLVATLTSPLTFGQFALVLPGLPELIVFFTFPYLRKR
ncbi:MAG: hypothetical protein ACMXYM_03935 [Candidatus Woesearchaeota archaeon]